MSLIAKRLQSIKPSPTLSVTAKAQELSSQGINIISLAAGEPDFDTPENIKNAAIDGIKNGATKYTNVSGTAELRQAVCDKFKRENNLDYTKDEIIISTGGKQVIYNLFMATINEGDEVIIPAPYWVSYPDIVMLAGGVPVSVMSDIKNGFKSKAEDISAAITKKSKWIILNSPSNPSGSSYSIEELKIFADVIRKNPQLNVMCDDIYEHITFDDFVFKTLAEIAPDLKDRIFIVNGVSKSYAMTGWRIGYGAGRKDVIKAMSMIQSQSTSNPSSISQIAATEALTGPQGYIKTNAANFQKKRDLVLSLLNKIPGIDCYKSEGAFYLFPKCSDLFGKTTLEGKKIDSSNDLASYLLESANVAVVPGIAFGLEGYFRISYATSEVVLEEACQRMSKSIMQLI
ncbi:MAG: pyridoxal phosphate-dependent aminotransferase [Rickettsiaceae bacterium]|nr:pyridoxal phosphate-dependent aminotransferase [Rickettsiaceae bacterium]